MKGVSDAWKVAFLPALSPVEGRPPALKLFLCVILRDARPTSGPPSAVANAFRPASPFAKAMGDKVVDRYLISQMLASLRFHVPCSGFQVIPRYTDTPTPRFVPKGQIFPRQVAQSLSRPVERLPVLSTPTNFHAT